MDSLTIFLLLLIVFMIFLVIMCSIVKNQADSEDGTRKIKFRRPKRFGHRGRKLKSNNCDIGRYIVS